MTINKNVTRKDVARKAGVSVSVVSRAINNSGYVEKDKKQRIIRIANEMGYIPNPVAMALQQRKTNQLLFFCTDLTGACFNQMYHGMAREAEKRGYHVLASMNIEDFDQVKRTLVDGILFNTEETAERYARSVGKNYHIPTVVASFQPSMTYAKSMPSVIIDNHEVINTMIDYLMKKGHRKIGIAIPFNEGYISDRFRHWKHRMMLEMGEECMQYLIDINDNSMDPDHRIDVHMNHYYNATEEFAYYDLVDIGRRAARKYVEMKNKPTVFICFNDDMAIGMVEELKKMGIRVPEELSVMGIDGIYLRDHHEPKLTTMSLFPDRQGAKCVEVLINMIEGRKYKHINYAGYEIIEGETVKTVH
ncbi:MAG: LacI family DNA-binding transcriptional regulator [Lachnospiraceae bacterium]|nr:LacI family DNA-binding transcriptional regulator [Lachnospiraceae bacterium]